MEFLELSFDNFLMANMAYLLIIVAREIMAQWIDAMVDELLPIDDHN